MPCCFLCEELIKRIPPLGMIPANNNQSFFQDYGYQISKQKVVECILAPICHLE